MISYCSIEAFHVGNIEFFEGELWDANYSCYGFNFTAVQDVVVKGIC